MNYATMIYPLLAIWLRVAAPRRAEAQPRGALDRQPGRPISRGLERQGLADARTPARHRKRVPHADPTGQCSRRTPGARFSRSVERVLLEAAEHEEHLLGPSARRCLRRTYLRAQGAVFRQRRPPAR